MHELHNRVALVTGSSRGIGKAISLALADCGVHLVINYLRKKSEAEATAKSIRSRGVRCLVVKANVAEDAEIEVLFDQIEQEYGRLDILVSNAASGVLKPSYQLTTRHFDWAMNINARALLPLAQGAARLMKTGGHIIAVSSLGAVRAIENYAAVGASKAALESLVRHLAVEMAPCGINVNTVQAGAVDTEALKHFPNREEILENTRLRVPARRLLTPDDVADVVILLCSDRARMIQGQSIVVDGGYSIVA
ncbi:MAG: enoyl-[acyl-carrier-protein] reductase FabL [Calditrichaeota bacterium]|nr:enoyl-[acyl-carrier-protein] reductase FabL [Calditrichota bacterium]